MNQAPMSVQEAEAKIHRSRRALFRGGALALALIFALWYVAGREEGGSLWYAVRGGLLAVALLGVPVGLQQWSEHRKAAAALRGHVAASAAGGAPPSDDRAV